MNVLLFGEQAPELEKEFDAYPQFSLVESTPEVVICYGGDGTLLQAERLWPGVAKVPIRNSRRGNRCIAHPPAKVIRRLAEDDLVRTEYVKLECALYRSGNPEPVLCDVAMNEINVHMGRINSALRFRIWIDDEPYGSDLEIIGDGFLIATPFGSTAYFNHLTRGEFRAGLGIAFKATWNQSDHLIVHEESEIRVLVTRGPAILGYDNSPHYIDLREGDQLLTRKHPEPAVILTWNEMKYPSDAF